MAILKPQTPQEEEQRQRRQNGVGLESFIRNLAWW